MYKANLSGEQNSYYLQELLHSKLIVQDPADDGCLVYRTTQKGREYLGYYFRMMELTDSVRNNSKGLIGSDVEGGSLIFFS
jgi:predicted transcriptional regulator